MTQVLRPHAEADRRALRATPASRPAPSTLRPPTWLTTVGCAGLVDRRRQDVHGRRADELRDEQIAGMLVELHRRADLLDAAVLQHDDAVGQRHRLDLVVGDVDHRRVRHRFLELGDLDAGGDAQRGVEVRQRLVEQEHLRIAHDGAADGDALALAARQRLGQAVEIFGQLQDFGRLRARAGRSRPCSPWRSSCRRPCCRRRSCADRARRTGTPWRCRASTAARR